MGSEPLATERIARFIANTRYEDIPGPVVDATKTIILDGVANLVAGSTQPVLDYIRLCRASGRPTGSPPMARSSKRSAAM